ncbi:MAG: signal peptide protein [Candidatus Pristimantibacillus sp.]
MNNYGHRPRQDNSSSRVISLIIGGIIFIVLIGVMLNSCGDSSATSWTSTSSSSVNTTQDNVTTLPWDYRIVEGTVGDLIGSDMTVLPDNELLPNDDNYATNDKVWTLQFMEANMITNVEGRNDVTLSAWKPIKSFKTKAAADKDIELLKLQITTEVDLVGVYKTEHEGQTRQFAVLTLPSGNQIKQPIDVERYELLKPLKTVKVIVEEVHDYADYDMAYAKFRGWAN